MKNIIFLISFILLVAWLTVLSLVMVNHRRTTVDQLEAITRQPNDTSDRDLVILRARIEQINDYHDDFLSTVHWSLGFVGTIFLILIGYSWFINFRVSAREQDNLKHELQTSLQASVVELRRDLESRADLSKQSIDSSFGELKNSISEWSQQAAQRATSEMTGKIESMNKSLLRLEYEIMDSRAEIQEAARQHNMVLTERLKTLDLALNMTSEYTISRNLVSITRALKSGGKVTDTELLRLRGLLEKLPNTFVGEAETIRNLLQDARMF